MLMMRAGEKKFSIKIIDVKNHSKIIQKFVSIDDATGECNLENIDLSTEKVRYKVSGVSFTLTDKSILRDNLDDWKCFLLFHTWTRTLLRRRQPRM